MKVSFCVVCVTVYLLKNLYISSESKKKLDRVKRIWYLSPMRAAKVQASLRIRAVSPEPLLLAHTSSESRGTFRQKARSLAPLNGWACAVKICHDGMLEDTNSLDGAQLTLTEVMHYVVALMLKSRFVVPNFMLTYFVDNNVTNDRCSMMIKT